MACCMQVAVGCGSICIFHVGGAADGDASSNRWEFFIGNHHMTTGNCAASALTSLHILMPSCTLAT